MFLGSGCQHESTSHQLARISEKKIFHELDVPHVYKVGITCFWAQDAKMSLTANTPLESARRKFFMNSTYHISRNHLFLGSGCQNESNSNQDRREVGISCFWAQDAKMSLTAIRSLESARKKFFMNSKYIMSTK